MLPSFTPVTVPFETVAIEVSAEVYSILVEAVAPIDSDAPTLIFIVFPSTSNFFFSTTFSFTVTVIEAELQFSADAVIVACPAFLPVMVLPSTETMLSSLVESVISLLVPETERVFDSSTSSVILPSLIVIFSFSSLFSPLLPPAPAFDSPVPGLSGNDESAEEPSDKNIHDLIPIIEELAGSGIESLFISS